MGSFRFGFFAKFGLFTAGFLLVLTGCQRGPAPVADKNDGAASAPSDSSGSSSEQRRSVPGPEVASTPNDSSAAQQMGKPPAGRESNSQPAKNSGRDRASDSSGNTGRPNQTPRGGGDSRRPDQPARGGGDSSRPDQPARGGGDSSRPDQPARGAADMGRPPSRPAGDAADAGTSPSAPKQPGHERVHAPPGTFVGSEIRTIEGQDFDGEDFTLEDYRGKVMMIDFWGDW